MSRLFFLLAGSLAAAIPEAQRTQIDTITGAKGVYTAAEDVYRVAFPRTDVKVAIEGRAMQPFLGLTSWAAFTPSAHGGLMVMGDLVLFEDEVNPVISAAMEAGLEVTALHNHFFFESPRVFFMHIGGMGTAEKLATGVRKALDRVREVRAARTQPASQFSGAPVTESSAITAEPLDRLFGLKGQVNNGMYKVTIGRPAKMHGSPVNNQMGVNTWAAFAGTDENALVDGDFAMLESEVQVVIRALRGGGINIVAIHHHMTHEEPRYVFLHYWGKGPALELARKLKSALALQEQKMAAVLFVCEHGAAKSVLAAAEFNRMAREKGLNVRAISRGTDPDAQLAPKVESVLRGEGWDTAAMKPAKVTEAEVAKATRVVTFACPLPGKKPAYAEDWAEVPAVSADFEKARLAIRSKVAKLIADTQ